MVSKELEHFWVNFKLKHRAGCVKKLFSTTNAVYPSYGRTIIDVDSVRKVQHRKYFWELSAVILTAAMVLGVNVLTFLMWILSSNTNLDVLKVVQNYHWNIFKLCESYGGCWTKEKYSVRPKLCGLNQPSWAVKFYRTTLTQCHGVYGKINMTLAVCAVSEMNVFWLWMNCVLTLVSHHMLVLYVLNLCIIYPV